MHITQLWRIKVFAGTVQEYVEVLYLQMCDCGLSWWQKHDQTYGNPLGTSVTVRSVRSPRTASPINRGSIYQRVMQTQPLTALTRCIAAL